MGNKKETGIRDGEVRLNVLNDRSRYTIPGINRINNKNSSNTHSQPEDNGNNTNLDQRVDNIEHKVDQVLGLLNQQGAQPTPQPQAPPVTEVTEDPEVVRRSRRIVD